MSPDLPHGLDPARMPGHVAVIMDGNGRWAKGKGWERINGHKRGAEAVRTVTTCSARWGVRRLTLYAFSTENWQRPALEVEGLMRLLADYLDNELPTLMDNGVRLTVIGQPERLPGRVRERLDRVMAATAGNTRMTLALALSYGGREEITAACRRIAERVAAGTLDPAAITPATVAAHLDDPAGDEVDCVIRTAGEQRLSNFLPWQAIYAEYVTTLVLWPDMDEAAYAACLREFQGRERRFGGVEAGGTSRFRAPSPG
jgi:undecaprenyl diphosphate synthase